ncbi:cell adhesion molecule CEACAM20 [Macrotis lagotis]|uniref:cell adhesion molecule CEACAM20 n=1 Tax=Macrotis lagotis TaxID=92651 RepID=UPI003D6964B2
MSKLKDIPHRGFSPWKRFLVTASFLTLWSLPGAAQYIITPQPSIAAEGDDVLLSVHGLQEGSYISLTWFQGQGFLNSILSYDTATKNVTIGSVFSNHEFQPSTGSLLIRTVKLTDSGDYTILVNSQSNGLKTATGSFQVYAKLTKPNIMVVPGNYIIEFQSPVEFICNPSQVNVRIRWFLNDTDLPLSLQWSLSMDNKTLTFQNVSRRNSGYYHCEVQNPVDSQKSDVRELIVYYGPDQVMITPDTASIWGNIIGVEINSNLMLECQTESNPAPHYVWYFNEIKLGTTSINHYITRASKNNQGNYKCIARNSKNGKSSSASVTVLVTERVTKPIVLASTTSIEENKGAVNFTCNTTDIEIEVYWLLNNQNLSLSDRLVLSQENRTLTITQVRREDAGEYQCTTCNVISRNSSDPVALIVNYGPDHLNITQKSGSSVVNDMEIKLGSTLTLLCRAHSHPAAQYHWSFNSNISLEQNGSLLSVEPVTQDHQGTYTCLAWNNLTQMSRSATVTIRVVDSSLSVGAIAGIVIGILAAVALTVGLVYFLVIRKRCSEKKSKEQVNGGESESVTMDALGSQRPTTHAQVGKVSFGSLSICKSGERSPFPSEKVENLQASF